MTDAFIAHLHDLFGAMGPISTRAMFGGHGLYFDGVIIGIFIDDVLYLKADAETRARFEQAGCSRFVYTSGKGGGQQPPITTSYWSLPDEALESAQAMLPWAQLAHAAALRKPKARRRTSRSKQSTRREPR